MMRFWFLLEQTILREGDGGGGGGASGGIAAAATAAAATAAAAEPPAAYYPEGLADDFRGTSDRETIDKLFARVKDSTAPQPYVPEGLADNFRGTSDRETIDKLLADIRGRPKPPEKPGDYKLELSPDFAKSYGELNEKDNKVLDVWRQTAHELGLDNKAFNGAFEKFYGNLDKAGLIEMTDPAAETEKLIAAQPKHLSFKEKATAVAKLANDVGAGVAALETRGILTKSQTALVSALLDTAEGINAVNALLNLMGEHGVQPGNGKGQQLTDHERAMQAMFPTMFKT